MSARDTSKPWIKNETTNVCELQCNEGYRSNLNDALYPAGNSNEQRCVYNICKRASLDKEAVSNACSECWDLTDINDPDWILHDKFTDRELAFADVEMPFALNPDTGGCELQCQPGFWSNSSSNFDSAVEDPFSVRCTYNNCKQT